MGKFSDLSRREEIALYSIRSEVSAVWQEVEQLPKYRQRNVAKMLRLISNHAALVLNSHGDDISSLPEDVDPLTQFGHSDA